MSILDEIAINLFEGDIRSAVATKAAQEVQTALSCAEWHEETLHYLALQLDALAHIFECEAGSEEVKINQDALRELQGIDGVLSLRRELAKMVRNTQLPLLIAFLSAIEKVNV